jgi:hypothetical protein
MIVYNTGYLKKPDVISLLEKGVKFGIYKTYKGTYVLVKLWLDIPKRIELYLPQSDRLPWKVIEGKKITYGDLVFNSTTNPIEDLTTDGWNNGNQIMSYEDYYLRD